MNERAERMKLNLKKKMKIHSKLVSHILRVSRNCEMLTKPAPNNSLKQQFQ